MKYDNMKYAKFSLITKISKYKILFALSNLLTSVRMYTSAFDTKKTQTLSGLLGKPCKERHEKQKSKKVQVGKDQEKAQPERDSHSKNRGGKKPN